MIVLVYHIWYNYDTYGREKQLSWQDQGGGDDKGRKEKLHHLFDGIGKFGGGNVAL